MKFAVFQFELVAKDELRLPLYKGSAFRGLFGHALKRTVCVTNMASCENCLLRQNCAYAYIFETFNERNERVAHPFVLEPPMLERSLFPPGDVLKVNLILFGKAIDYLPYIVYTFREMGKRGIGAKRGKFWLQRVTKDEKIVYDFQEQLLHTDFTKEDLFQIKNKDEHIKKVKIRFVTPTAIKKNGKINSNIDFLTLLKAVKRRVKALSIYHNGNLDPEFNIDFEAAKALSIINTSFEPFHWKRYSNRQQQKIDFSGFIGELELEGDLTPFMSLLRMGEIIHIGRGTVYGMGKYVVEV